MAVQKQNVLVAGATGYLGGFVARELKSRGHFVRALARSPGRLEPLKDTLDEIVQAEITVPATLEGICEGIDTVFSSVGITKQKDGLTFRDVDYQGNRNLLQAARAAGVKKFIYVSVFNGPALRHLDIVRAHEDFVDELKASGIDYAVIRPTGYFSDMGEFFTMASRGRVYLFGDGKNRVNPIHGADLAEVCADTLESGRQEIDVGGPEVLSWGEIAELAFAVLGKPARISHVPLWIAKAAVAAARLFNRHRGELMAFFVEMGTGEVVAPAAGTHTLARHFEGLARQEGGSSISLSSLTKPE